MKRTGTAVLTFDPALDRDGKPLVAGLSAVVANGDSLWLANDESVSLERLTRQPGAEPGYGNHRRFALGDYLRLPAPAEGDAMEEADIEGLDIADGYLWLVGSHSLKRGKPDGDDTAEQNGKRLAKVRRDGNRYLLARIPLVTAEGGHALAKTAERDGTRLHAAQLRGDAKGNALTAALADDKHLRDFLAIPGKDNGFDIEGLAVSGPRLFVGLRGPVLRGWAIVLELEPVADADDPHSLDLARIGPDGRPYRKHFLQLGGLGIRDLCVQGADLLILAGPTMDLDGPVTLHRWRGGARPEDESVVADAPVVADIAYGRGVDHAEGMALLPDGTLIVVHDATADSRRDDAKGTVTADIYRQV